MSSKTFLRFFLLVMLAGGLCVGKEDVGLKKKNKDKGEDKPKAAVENQDQERRLGPALGTDADKEDELFEKLPLPEKRPKLVDEILSAARKNYSELAELYDDLGMLIREKQLLLQETDAKQARKNKREIEKLDKKIYKQKKDLVKTAKKLRRPLDRKMEGLQKDKEDYDKKIESAEKSGNEKRVQKIAQEFSRKGHDFESTQRQLDSVNYFLFWDDFMK